MLWSDSNAPTVLDEFHLGSPVLPLPNRLAVSAAAATTGGSTPTGTSESALLGAVSTPNTIANRVIVGIMERAVQMVAPAAVAIEVLMLTRSGEESGQGPVE